MKMHIKECWFESDEFHVITEHDEHLVFKGAYINNREVEIKGESLVETEVDFVAQIV